MLPDLPMYAILVGGVIMIWWAEHVDIHCPSFNSSQKECEEGGGMSFSNTKPKDSDTCDILMQKIFKAAGAETNAVKWRKAFLLSVCAITAVWILVHSPIMHISTTLGMSPFSLPKWQIFYLSVMVGFVVIMGSYLYYSYHVYGVAENWLKMSLTLLVQKGCVANT